jgi:hypothetical protein
MLSSILLINLSGCGESSTTNSNNTQSTKTENATKSTQLISSDSTLPQLYIRGSFNGWGTKDKLVTLSDGLLGTKIRLSYGVFEFKLATDSWSQEYAVQANGDKTIDALDTDTYYAVDNKKPAGKSFLLVTTPGQYQLTLNTHSKPFKLSVSKTDHTYFTGVAPHQGSKQSLTFSSFDNHTQTVTFSSQDVDGLKEYVHETTAVLRDPVPSFSVYREEKSLPYVRSGNMAFDALFALAIDEMKLDSVDVINTSNYNGGQSIACECFETGEKWNYVWTRDLAYSAHLSLGLLDPQRVKNSLLFKLSPYRDAVPKAATVAGSNDGLQIIQDTGSGGSWPISTDRVTWSFGAASALNNLSDDQRTPFAKTTFNALTNTLEIDRQVAFDKTLGLYSGEQSFLDWREQTYAPWIASDLSSMATSIAISTNAGHYHAIKLAKDLAIELNKPALAKRYQQWETALKSAINIHLWLPEHGLYSSLTAGHFDHTPLEKFDWLGQSLAIITGIASPEQATQILSRYPHGPMGAPVIFPQQPNIGVYHNRAIWPFVTAYGLKAAKIGRNTQAANSAYQTLIRGAALNLSNMENLEWLSAQAMWLEKEKPSLSGPAINSKRQLWSVAGYLNMVIESLFGLETTQAGLTIAPLMTTTMHQTYFSNHTKIQLNNLTWLGKKLNITLKLPSINIAQPGIYTVSSVTLNNKRLNNHTILLNQLSADNNIVVTLNNPDSDDSKILLIDAKTGPKDTLSFAPMTPTFTLSSDRVRNKIKINSTSEDSLVSYRIHRNGKLITQDLSSLNWQEQPQPFQACYAVSAVFNDSKNSSHHSQVQCQNIGHLWTFSATNVSGNKQPKDGTLLNWGKPQDKLIVNDINVEQVGRYAFSWQYHNLQHQINTGITAGVKWMILRDVKHNVVATGVVQMPHNEATHAYSTPLITTLKQGKYSVELTDFFNMSYLENNQSYTGVGGVAGPVNQIDLFGLRVMPLIQ